MKRIAVLILALALMLTGSALAVYDPAASTPTMWDGEVTTITFTSRLPNIVLENNPVLKRVEEAVGVRLEISVLDAAQYNSLIACRLPAATCRICSICGTTAPTSPSRSGPPRVYCGIWRS